MSERYLRVPPQEYFFVLSNRQYSGRAAALLSRLSNGNPKGAVIGAAFSFVSFFVAYMDVGKGREQDAEA